MNRKSKVARRRLGKAVRELRKREDLSQMELTYVLDLGSIARVSYWESGRCFPRSIIVLKKLEFLFSGFGDVVREVVDSHGVKPNKKEWMNFIGTVSTKWSVDSAPQNRNKFYNHVDARDAVYRKAFGRYLREARTSRSITAASLGRAFGCVHTTWSQWEAGINFPSDILVLGLINRLFGDTFDVVFSVCDKARIRLQKKEKQSVLRRLKNIQETRGNRSKEYRDYFSSFYATQAVWRNKMRCSS